MDLSFYTVTQSENFLYVFHCSVSTTLPWKHQKTRGFAMFSGGIEKDQWHEMGERT